MGPAGSAALAAQRGSRQQSVAQKQKNNLVVRGMETNQFLPYVMFGTTVWMHQFGTSEFRVTGSKLRANFSLRRTHPKNHFKAKSLNLGQSCFDRQLILPATLRGMPRSGVCSPVAEIGWISRPEGLPCILSRYCTTPIQYLS
jgi:hypothetical protein